METLDLTKVLKDLFTASPKRAEFIEAPPLNILAIDGVGSPDKEVFQNAVGALYSLSYTIKFTLKMRKENPMDHKVMPLEALWWTDEPGSFDINRREEWRWTAMIVQQDYITAQDVESAAVKAAERRPNPSINSVKLATFDEGSAAQIMHVGPYSTEAETIARLHAAIEEIDGKHHEIYLGDPRRTAPEKLKTILRQPYRMG